MLRKAMRAGSDAGRPACHASQGDAGRDLGFRI